MSHVFLSAKLFDSETDQNALEGQRSNTSLKTHFLWGISGFAASGKMHFLYAPCGATRTFPNIIGLDIHYFMPAFRTVTIYLPLGRVVSYGVSLLRVWVIMFRVAIYNQDN